MSSLDVLLALAGLVVTVLVIAGMGLRMFRLAEPARMHFDEVYHARTATEFLQSWRYGIDHTIYEWTHPHLAKYVMAGGITVRSIPTRSSCTSARTGASCGCWTR